VVFSWPIYLYIIQHASTKATFNKRYFFERRNHEISLHPDIVALKNTLGQTETDLRRDKQVELSMKKNGMERSSFYFMFENELTLQ
jgi:hypothetical protein